MSDASAFDPCPRVAAELNLPLSGVRAVVKLLAEGGSVPFIARYRKEQTDGLDEVQIRAIEEKCGYYTELHDRRVVVLGEIEKQGKLTAELRKRIEACWVKAELEDLYLPYKPKRRTRAMIARERGLEPLALRILEQPLFGDVLSEASAFVDIGKEVADTKVALAGARDIVAEMMAERADVRALVRDRFTEEGEVVSMRVPEKTQQPTKFEAYYDFRGKAKVIPSHRFLAIRRGEAEGVLRSSVEVDKDALVAGTERLAKVNPASPFARELRLAAKDSVERLLIPSIENDVRVDLKLNADREAVAIFAENLRKLLLAAPLGRRKVIGIDPGQRSGCKCVVVDDTGKLLTHTLINLVTGDHALAHAKKTVAELIKTHEPFAIAVGNGTHGRETADFARDVVKELDMTAQTMTVLVSEAGASVYSASDVARDEFPDLDLTVRGAISIARRLQDPLAELVKIDPKAIGVGQYQHDVFQSLLKRKLEEVVESCVNAVGVELNTASAPLLAHVAGLTQTIAKRIVTYRNERGAFKTRQDLLSVSGFGPKAFEQCAGFVRIRDSANPLDASAVHPERYGLVEQMAKDLGARVVELVGNTELIGRVNLQKYVSASVGLPTLEDIRRELLKPGRDPRDVFEPPAFRDDVRTMEDLKVGMMLEGIVTNVTAFGAFVDVGVHQDGLVHLSQLSDRFVKDPHEVAKVGDKMRVRVLEIDLARKRISLSAKSDAAQVQRATALERSHQGVSSGQRQPSSQGPNFSNKPFAGLLRK